LSRIALDPKKGNPMKFRKKPVTIEALQFTDHHVGESILDWVNGNGGNAFTLGTTDAPRMAVRTLEGTHEASVGDWIIQGVAGEFYPCKPEIFAATYEPAE
jgi:hypothetical protein